LGSCFVLLFIFILLFFPLLPPKNPLSFSGSSVALLFGPPQSKMPSFSAMWQVLVCLWVAF